MQNHYFPRIFAVIFLAYFLQTGLSRAEVKKEASQDQGFFYVIQKGDTLWDLSKRFYNDQWTWPGLWEMNHDIKNPHWIFPGKKIHIFLTETLTAPPPMPPPVMPKHERKQTQPWKVEPFFEYPSMDSLGFVKEEPIDSLGKIIGSQSNNLMMASGETIYIAPSKGTLLIPGHDYRIISTEPVFKDFKSEKFNGIKHTILGIVKIIGVEDSYTTALITRSFDHAATGDLIAPFEPSSEKIKVEKSIENIDARILCSLANDAVLSEHEIAFINRGNNHGIKPGQTYTLFEERAEISTPWKIADTVAKPIKIKNRAVGKVIVLHTENTASTVLILSCSKEFNPGMLVD